MIRDNKGTPDDPKDDMTINELTFLEFDDPTQRISSDSHVVINDAEMITSGDGLLVQLGKSGGSTPGASSGFDGVEFLELFKNVHVILRDVGKSGIIPGKTEQGARQMEPLRSNSRSSEGRNQPHKPHPSNNQHHST